MLHRGHNDLLALLLLEEDHVIAHLCGVLRLELKLDITPIFPGPHTSSYLHLLLMLPPSLLGFLLLPGIRHLLLGGYRATPSGPFGRCGRDL